ELPKAAIFWDALRPGLRSFAARGNDQNQKIAAFGSSYSLFGVSRASVASAIEPRADVGYG
ncbi:hypothetical protein, partial [Pseudomonas sp. Sample_23]|uniref:hypothetical protein n=1 Tax=Pseudomonas sp. Sample_23 TaxID=2448267 RepID=UPI0019D67FFF